MNIYLKTDYNAYQKRVVDFISVYILIFGLNLLVRLIIRSIPGWNYISMSILGVLLALMLKSMPKQVKSYLFFYEGLILILIFFSFLMGNYTASFRSICFNVCIVYLPLAIGLYGLSDFDSLLKRLYIYSWPLQLILVYTLMHAETTNNYSMPGGYALLFILLVVMDHYSRSRKWYDLAAIIVDFFIIFVFASRGPLVCASVFILLNLLFSTNIPKKKKLFRAVIAVLLIIIFLLFYDWIISVLVKLLSFFGFRSRTLRMLLNKEIAVLSGRQKLNRFFFQRIGERPIFGWGLSGGWRDDQNHPHNLFVEMILSYGFIIGGFFSILIIILFVKGIKKKDASQRRLVHILVSYNVSLLMSSSYLLTPYFFMCLALCARNVTPSQAISDNSKTIY